MLKLRKLATEDYYTEDILIWNEKKKFNHIYIYTYIYFF